MSLENMTAEQRDELAALAQQLAENPKTRKGFLGLTKELKPDLPIPELEIERATNEAVSRAESRVRELQDKLEAREALDQLESRRRALVKKGLVSSEDEIQDVEKIMLEKKIADHETAAQYHQWMKEAATPTPSQYQPNLMKGWDLGKYMKNPVTAARDEAAKALQDLRRPNRPIGL